MKILCAISFLLTLSAVAQIEVAPEKEPQSFFKGEQRLQVMFKNVTDKDVSAVLRLRLYQESSATMMPLGEATAWKTLRLLPHQTVLETVTVDLPEVRALTSFQVRWINETNVEIGKMPLRVYPNTLLKSLSDLARKNPVAVLDPDNQIKPLLKTAGVEFHDVETGAGLDGFEGRLAIIGPFLAKSSVPENLRWRIINRARKTATSIVWILPEEMAVEPFLPIYIVREAQSAIAVIQPSAMINLKESPQAQLQLLRAAQLTVAPESLRLPPLNSN